MIKDVLKSIDEIKKTIISLEKNLKLKTDEVESISKKNIELEDELKNLSKVSLVAGLTRQVDDKNHQIKLLEQQLNNYKKMSRKTSKFIVEDSHDSEEDKDSDKLIVENGYQLITYENKRLLKNLETRKLYHLGMNGTKGKYAGKESKKGKIKLKD
jgi:hypothetical protein